MSASQGNYQPPAPLSRLLEQIQWDGMAILVPILNMNIESILIVSSEIPDYSEHRLIGQAWWKWPAVRNADMPAWWNSPSDSVVCSQ